MVAGCSSYQPTKNVWKGTKDVWYTYVSPPASVDYGEKGDLSPRALALTNCMMGLDVELGRFERTMINADKPPTRQWMDSLFAAHPWLDGFAGVKYDGTLLGQEPANPLKQLDFIPLLYEDKKQGSRALRAGVQQTPMGPEVMLAAPLYDGVDFLGIVVAYFDMRNLVQYSGNPQDMVILSPQALLWPGKYDYAATPRRFGELGRSRHQKLFRHLHQRDGELLLHGALSGQPAAGLCRGGIRHLPAGERQRGSGPALLPQGKGKTSSAAHARTQEGQQQDDARLRCFRRCR